jgi:glycosyltransferase involved in cell wall biosynthesis
VGLRGNYLKGPKVSIIIPVFNEEGNVKELHRRVTKEIGALTDLYEIVFVDDGSTDNTLSRLRSIMKDDPNVRTITFYRNFGKANALSTGFEHATGDIVFTMDGDLQDDPAEFKNFLRKLNEGYDIVSGWKLNRQDPIGKRAPSLLFNYLVRKMTGVNVHDSNCGFKAYRGEVVKMMDVYGEFHRYLPIMANWRGFRVAEIRVRHHRRKSGRSKYGLERLFKGFMDLITIAFLTKRGRSPLYLFAACSALLLALVPLGVAFTIADGLLGLTGSYWAFGLATYLTLLSSLVIFMMGFGSELLLAAVGHRNLTKNHYRVLTGK